MAEAKEQKVDENKIEHFLQQTGFVFEMRANEILLNTGYTTDINAEFLDLEGNTLREIDIIATKVINDVNCHLVVECKQSVTDKWIFICNKNMPRFYHSVKHLPNLSGEILREKKVFAGFHVHDKKILVGHNYLVFFKGEKKQSIFRLMNTYTNCRRLSWI